MSILVGEYLFCAKTETTYGVAETIDASVNAMRVKTNLKVAEIEMEAMEYDAGRTGSKGAIEKRRYVKGDLAAYLAGSGVATAAPALAPLMKAAGLKLTAEVDHVAVTLEDLGAVSSVTGAFFRSKVKQIQPGARCSWEIELSVDNLPKFNFPNYMALYNDQTVEASLQNADFSALKNPIPLDPTSFVRRNIFGFAADISKVNIKGNCEVQYLPESKSVEILDRKVQIEIEFAEPSPADKDFWKLLGTYGAVDLQNGQDIVDEGYIFEVLASNAQLSALDSTERNKKAYLKATFDCIPTAANNEITMKWR